MKRWLIVWLAVICLVAAVPVAWVGYHVVSNRLAARDAHAALHEAVPGGATVVHEDVHPCATDDPAGPPYCGIADIFLSQRSTEICRQAILHQITAHGYVVFSNVESADDPYVSMEFVRGNDDIYVEMREPAGAGSNCQAMIIYQRDPAPKTHV